MLLAKNNAQLFSQTLSFTDPTQEDITKNELIQVCIFSFEQKYDLYDENAGVLWQMQNVPKDPGTTFGDL